MSMTVRSGRLCTVSDRDRFVQSSVRGNVADRHVDNASCPLWCCLVECISERSRCLIDRGSCSLRRRDYDKIITSAVVCRINQDHCDAIDYRLDYTEYLLDTRIVKTVLSLIEIDKSLLPVSSLVFKKALFSITCNLKFDAAKKLKYNYIKRL